MTGSIDKVLQSDGSYKWEVVDHPREADSDPVVKTSKTTTKPKAATTKTTETTD
tara:strand:+ start:773 stop:934 length:162 start_codon:yes stop_codon:yes gene_type:complete